MFNNTTTTDNNNDDDKRGGLIIDQNDNGVGVGSDVDEKPNEDNDQIKRALYHGMGGT